MSLPKVGIIGCGFVGSTLVRYLQEHSACEIRIKDPFKGYHDDVSGCDVIFVGIHVPTKEDGTQALELFDALFEENHLPKSTPIFIRTTILPGVSKQLSEKYHRKIYFMPEFLRERCAYEDFIGQPLIITGERELLDPLFAAKEKIYMNSTEAEWAKYAHNAFAAMTVSFFNGLYRELGEDCSYDQVRKGVLASGFITPVSNQVPGPDGKFGYGGKCLPKDINALHAFVQNPEYKNLLKSVIDINNIVRKD